MLENNKNIQRVIVRYLSIKTVELGTLQNEVILQIVGFYFL